MVDQLSQDTSGYHEKGREATGTASLETSETLSQRRPVKPAESSSPESGTKVRVRGSTRLQRSQSRPELSDSRPTKRASRSSQTFPRLTGLSTHMTQWAMLNDKSHGSAAASSKRLAAPEGWFFSPQGCETKGHSCSLTEAHSEVRKREARVVCGEASLIHSLPPQVM